MFVLSRASDNTTLNIGGPMHLPSPRLKSWGRPPRSPPLPTLSNYPPKVISDIRPQILLSLSRHTCVPRYTGWEALAYSVGLNRVPNFAEYRLFEAVFADYRYRVFDKV